MATKKQTREEMASDLAHNLLKIRNLIGVCGFAAEMRRTLEDIENATQINPALGTELSRLVKARNEWVEHPDELGPLLKEIGCQLEAAIDIATGLYD